MTAQITIFLDTTGLLHAEAPGKNGARRKLDIINDSDLFATLRGAVYTLAEDLLAQKAEEKLAAQKRLDREKHLARERHDRIIEYALANYGLGAEKTIRAIDPAYNFSLALKRKRQQSVERTQTKKERSTSALDRAYAQIVI